MADPIVPLRWQDDRLLVLDQLRLPGELHWLTCTSARDVAGTIKDMNIRGAPAIGVAAAFGVYLGLKGMDAHRAAEEFPGVRKMLAATRPTAVNLFWALDRMERIVLELKTTREEPGPLLLAEAGKIRDEDEASCRAMGRLGAELIPERASVLTHCNAGALATAAYGTALGIIRTAFEQDRIEMVYCDETRPYLQGARLTAWELHHDGIPCRLLCDNMPGSLMARGMIDAVVVGADRIAANGDVANKIGTYQLAVLCNYHDIPFYVAAPTSTVDLSIGKGADIPIEQRSSGEVVNMAGKRIAPEGVKALHPAFDVTPAELVSAIITEKKVLTAPYSTALAEVARC